MKRCWACPQQALLQSGRNQLRMPLTNHHVRLARALVWALVWERALSRVLSISSHRKCPLEPSLAGALVSQYKVAVLQRLKQSTLMVMQKRLKLTELKAAADLVLE